MSHLNVICWTPKELTRPFPELDHDVLHIIKVVGQEFLEGLQVTDLPLPS